MEQLLNTIRDEIYTLNAIRRKAQFIVLDYETWKRLLSDMAKPEVGEAIQLSEEQQDPTEPHKIFGINVAILTGSTGQVVEVV